MHIESWVNGKGENGPVQYMKLITPLYTLEKALNGTCEAFTPFRMYDSFIKQI